MARVALTMPGLVLAATLPLDPAIIGRDVAQYLNYWYTGFDKNDDESPLGVTISMQHTWALYCGTGSADPGSGLFDPGSSWSPTDAGCYEGHAHFAHADCRLSASLYNNQMGPLNAYGAITQTWGRVAGIVINQTMVESSLGKCSYMFDGVTYNRYNRGCGCASTRFSCTNPESAFGNVCPSTNIDGPFAYQICATEAKEVAQCSCDAMDIGIWTGRTESVGADGVGVPRPQCFFKGAGFDTTRVQHSSDQTRQMVKERLKHQWGTGRYMNDVDDWNEIVIDEHLMLEQLREDPEPVIPAFVYIKSNPEGLDYARKMRDDYVLQFSVKKQIPLIAVDHLRSPWSASGPFSYEDVEQVQEALLI